MADIPSTMPTPKQHHYWWQCLKTLGHESYRTWRGELLASVLFVLVAYGITYHSDPTAWATLKVGLISSAIVLAGFALWHLFRTPWLVHQDTLHGRDTIGRGFGFIGILVLVALIALPFALWKYIKPTPRTITVTVAAPCPKLQPQSAPAPTQKVAKPAEPPKVDIHIKQQGSGDAANPGTTTAPVKVEPCGVFQNGGSNNTASTNCVPPERHLTDSQKAAITGALKGKHVKVRFGSMLNVPDGQQFAYEICDAFKEAQVIQACEVHYMTSAGKETPWVGFELRYKGAAGKDGDQVDVPGDSPAGIVLGALSAAGFNLTVVSPIPDFEEGMVEVIVGRPPPPN